MASGALSPVRKAGANEALPIQREGNCRGPRAAASDQGNLKK